MVSKLFDKKSSGNVVKSKIIKNKQLAEELHKPNIRNLKREEYSHLLNTIFGLLILQICN